MAEIIFLGPNDSVANTGADGRVGIGTTSPDAQLDVHGSGDRLLFIEDTANGNRLLIGTDDQLPNFLRLRPQAGDGLAITNTGDKIGVFVRASNANVGIGTTSPGEKLEVQGNILVTGDVKLAGADCAEDFNVEECQELDPGTVMVIGNEDKLHQSAEAYDKKVAGVLSGAGNYKSGIVLDKQRSPNKRMPLALSGKVYCKVDTQYSPIEVGDLLTTSPHSRTCNESR